MEVITVLKTVTASFMLPASSMKDQSTFDNVSMKWAWFILLKLNLHAGVVRWEWCCGGVMVELEETGTDNSSAGWCRSNGSKGATEGLMQETITVVAALAKTKSS